MAHIGGAIFVCGVWWKWILLNQASQPPLLYLISLMIPAIFILCWRDVLELGSHSPKQFRGDEHQRGRCRTGLGVADKQMGMISKLSSANVLIFILHYCLIKR